MERCEFNPLNTLISTVREPHMSRNRSVCASAISFARKIAIPPGSSLLYQKTKKYHFSTCPVENMLNLRDS